MIEATLYVKKVYIEVGLVISLYVDDLLIIGISLSLINVPKLSMTEEIEMIDLGEINYFLRMGIFQCKHGIFIS